MELAGARPGSDVPQAFELLQRNPTQDEQRDQRDRDLEPQGHRTCVCVFLVLQGNPRLPPRREDQEPVPSTPLLVPGGTRDRGAAIGIENGPWGPDMPLRYQRPMTSHRW